MKLLFLVFAILATSCAETKFNSSTQATEQPPVQEEQDSGAIKPPKKPEIVEEDEPEPELPDGIATDRDVSATITFQDETAGFQNTLGWYLVDNEGNIHSADIVWENASHSSSHHSYRRSNNRNGPLKPDDQTTIGPIQEGMSLRFFLIAGGYTENNWENESEDDYIDRENGQFEFRTSKNYDNGDLATVQASSPSLFYVPENGSPILIESRSSIFNDDNKNAIYHASFDSEASLNLNPDGYNHIQHKEVKKGVSWDVGVEDLYFSKNSTEFDGDFTDLIFKVEFEISD